MFIHVPNCQSEFRVSMEVERNRQDVERGDNGSYDKD